MSSFSSLTSALQRKSRPVGSLLGVSRVERPANKQHRLAFLFITAGIRRKLHLDTLLEKDSKGHQRTCLKLVPERPVIERVKCRLAVLNRRAMHCIQQFLCKCLLVDTFEGS